MVKKSLIVILLVFIEVILFAPKLELYYLLEHKLDDALGVVVNEKVAKETPFGLDLEGLRVYYEGADIATIKDINIFSLLLFSKVKALDIEPSAYLNRVAKFRVSTLDLIHSISNPFFIEIKANGSFGEFKGGIDLRKRVIKLRLVEAKDITSIREFLKRDKEGWYYEQSF